MVYRLRRPWIGPFHWRLLLRQPGSDGQGLLPVVHQHSFAARSLREISRFDFFHREFPFALQAWADGPLATRSIPTYLRSSKWIDGFPLVPLLISAGFP